MGIFQKQLLKHQVIQLTLTDLQNVVKEWLCHAGDRVRYQRKKEVTAMERI